MIVEVLAVGTELLLGQIVNGNGAAIGRRLAEEGFDSHFQTVVGDNMDRLVEAFSVAVNRSDAIVITGGIGPTQDDLTRYALAELAGVGMTRDHAHAEWIEARIRAAGREPASNVLRMADLPEGAIGLPNFNGVALGVAIRHTGKWLFAMPGVPAEMIPMLENEVLPRLREAAGEPAVLRSRVLHCWGLGESALADLLDDLFASKNPSVAFLIRDMEVRVRITAKADSEGTALALIDPMEAEIRARLGEVVFAVDEETVEGLVVDEAARAGWTVGTMERATLGLVGARLAIADTTGRVFAGAYVPGVGAHVPFEADVLVSVGDVGGDVGGGRRTTRAVDISVQTPAGELDRRFEFGGDDERLRSFATLAALHQLRIALAEIR